MERTLEKLRRKQAITCVVLGDSNTLVSMNTQGRLNWVGYLAEALWERYGDGLTTMINVSECGYTFHRLPDELDRKILRWDPDLVIFQLWLGGGIDNRPEECEAAKRHFVDVVKRIRDHRDDDVDILVCTPNPRVLCHGHDLPDGVEPGTVYETTAWNTERNAELVELAKANGCDVVDHFTAWKAKTYEYAHPGANPRGLWQRMIDSVHPNALGQLVLFREMAPTFDVATHFPWEEVRS